MNTSTRRWVSLSALSLLALDLGAFAIAAPRARAWAEHARASGLLRAGVAAVRDLERVSARGAENAGFALLTHFARRSGRAYAFILHATPPAGMRDHTRTFARRTRMVMVESRCVQAEAMVGPSSCPLSTCPRHDASSGTVPGSSAIGLPTSALRITVE